MERYFKLSDDGQSLVVCERAFIYEVVNGAFKGDFGLLQPSLLQGTFFLKTGIDTRVMVSSSELREARFH